MFAAFTRHLQLYVSRNRDEDHWYEEGMLEAASILGCFEEDDWISLLSHMTSQSGQWKIYCCEIMGDYRGRDCFRLLQFLRQAVSASADHTLALACADALRNQMLAGLNMDEHQEAVSGIMLLLRAFHGRELTTVLDDISRVAGVDLSC